MRVVEIRARTVDEAVAEALMALGASRDDVEVEVLDEGNKGLFGLLGAKQARVRVRLRDGAADDNASETGTAPGGIGDASSSGSGSSAVEPAAGPEKRQDREEDEVAPADAIPTDAAGAGFRPSESDEEKDDQPGAAAPAGPPDERRVARARSFLTGVLERMEVDAGLESRIDEDGTVHINIVGEDLGLVIGRRGQTLDALQFLVNQVANRGDGRRVRIVLDVEGYRARRAEALTALARRTAARVRRQGRKVALEPMNALERRVVHLALAAEKGVETYSEGEEPHRRVIIAPRGS